MGTVQYEDPYKMKEKGGRMRIREGDMMMKTGIRVIPHFIDEGAIYTKNEANKNKSLETK